MTLRTDLVQLANDYGIPGEAVCAIEADAEHATFTYFATGEYGAWHVVDDEAGNKTFAKNTVTVSIDASPVRDEGTPIYDALVQEAK